MQATMVVAPTIATTIAIIQRRLSLIFCLFMSTLIFAAVKSLAVTIVAHFVFDVPLDVDVLAFT